MAPGAVTDGRSSEQTVDLTGGSKPAGSSSATPSPRVSNAGPAVALSSGIPLSPAIAAAAMNGTAGPSSSGVVALHTRLAERVERARDTIMDTELYGTLSSVSSRVGANVHAAWEFSKKASWIIGTSALILVVPLLYEMDKELVGNDPAASGAATTTGDSGSAPADGAAPAPAT